MTKQDEMQILNNAIVQLGADSYLGPWLSSVRAEVTATIESDFFPTVSLNQTARDCTRLLDDTKARSLELINQADKHASKTIADARATADQIRRRVIVTVREALDSLTD